MHYMAFTVKPKNEELVKLQKILISISDYKHLGKKKSNALNYFLSIIFFKNNFKIIDEIMNSDLFSVGRVIYENRTGRMFIGREVSRNDCTILHPIIFLGTLYQHKITKGEKNE